MRYTTVFFVAGTDTDVGKTIVTCGLLKKAESLGLSTLGIKPIASGSAWTDKGLRNSDAMMIRDTMTCTLPYEAVNPTVFEPAIAPHIAASQEKVTLSPEKLAQNCIKTLEYRSDFALIEGAGGWFVPLSPEKGTYLSDMVRILAVPTILVVGVRLGCLNHARLSVKAILQDKVPFAGWVANRVDPSMPCFEENLDTLKQFMPGAFLGCIPYLEDTTPNSVAKHLSIEPLLKR